MKRKYNWRTSIFYRNHTKNTLRPIVSPIHAPTTGISRMLDQLIRPLFDQHVQTTTFIDDVQFIRRLEFYAQLELLKPTTYLCTCDVTDLSTMLPQEESIGILKQFLRTFQYSHVKDLILDVIESLARIVLQENVFIYEQKYYRQIKGGAMGSPFTLTLANIFIWHSEQPLVEHQRNSNELYGRYIDDIFLTLNHSIEQLNRLLQEANDRHPNIKTISTTENPNSFLDVNVRNVGTHLITSVYHKEAAEPYVVPFRSDHPRHVFINIIECALLRALRYSSTSAEFNHERRLIKLMLLYNGYPAKFIYNQFRKFLAKYFIVSTLVIPMIHDENEFLFFRRQLLDQTTVNEHRRAARLSKTFDYNNFPSNIDPLVKEKLLKRKARSESVILHYIHEKRFQHYGRIIHQIWDETFQNLPIRTPNLIVGTRNNPNLVKELVRRNPFKKFNNNDNSTRN